ncbi:hypothetical protein COLO4_02938 [Corchorus olitorius]|uniref:non-specific serine/threonine protein kinase n=1 Tax=Corchorus olitorius TaxID=93759 RepID=A0A1R3KZV6_9ROSI|nr:hypothetical protein COLO4_02938 [Corchorus olitorius]
MADANFAIKCGGPQKIYNGVVFEPENTTLNPATFNVTGTQKWAVSNAGLFADRENQQFVENTLVQVTSTNTPELYQTSRVSPGSLRYYGLGLENGNYTITLYFAETGFPSRSTRTWRSLARRVFDVYIQGTRRLRDFDISKEAGGVEIAVTKNFTINVTENHFEIHLFWADFKPSVSGLPPGIPRDKNHTPLIVGIAVPLAGVALILILAIIYFKSRKEADDEEVLLGIGPRPNTFSYAELKTATEDFCPSNKLGEGGFGVVFKGTLGDGRVVAVKQLLREADHGKSQFVTEIATISAVQHRNLVKLHGCCIEGNRRLLVYEYLENKSLDQALFGESELHLNWPTRFNICLSTARGLAYLHEESRPRIVHRDVKASNILLDAELCPKISDFGLAKLYDDKKTHISTKAWNLVENNESLGVMDPSLEEFDENEALRVLGVALLCTQASPNMRPPMSRVVAMLTGDAEVSSVATKPSYITDWDFNDETATFKKDAQTSSASDNSDDKISTKNKTINETELIISPINVTEISDIIGEGR